MRTRYILAYWIASRVVHGLVWHSRGLLKNLLRDKCEAALGYPEPSTIHGFWVKSSAVSIHMVNCIEEALQ